MNGGDMLMSCSQFITSRSHEFCVCIFLVGFVFDFFFGSKMTTIVCSSSVRILPPPVRHLVLYNYKYFHFLIWWCVVVSANQRFAQFDGNTVNDRICEVPIWLCTVCTAQIYPSSPVTRLWKSIRPAFRSKLITFHWFHSFINLLNRWIALSKNEWMEEDIQKKNDELNSIGK